MSTARPTKIWLSHFSTSSAPRAAVITTASCAAWVQPGAQPPPTAWTTAEDTAENEMAPEDVALAKRWIAAAGRARGDAFQAMGETEAWFEVRIER